MTMDSRQAHRLLLSLALAAAAVATLGLMLSTQSARAQAGDDIYVDKRLGRADPVVRVGEYLTFTILIRNDSAFTVTTLPLSDTYDAAVLAYAGAVPPPDVVDEGAGRIDWADLTTATPKPKKKDQPAPTATATPVAPLLPETGRADPAAGHGLRATLLVLSSLVAPLGRFHRR
jgi:uncharacterized repeat protein (TIGR01451 family)